MLNSPFSGFLALLRGSTRVIRRLEALEWRIRSPRYILAVNGSREAQDIPSSSSTLAAALIETRRVLARQSLAGEMPGLSEHSETTLIWGRHVRYQCCIADKLSFSATCYDGLLPCD